MGWRFRLLNETVRKFAKLHIGLSNKNVAQGTQFLAVGVRPKVYAVQCRYSPGFAEDRGSVKLEWGR